MGEQRRRSGGDGVGAECGKSVRIGVDSTVRAKEWVIEGLGSLSGFF